MTGAKPTTLRVHRVKKNHIRAKLTVFAALAALLLLVAIFSEQLCPYDPYAQDLSIAQQAPSIAHLMGTDRYGRDMFSRVLVGSRTSIYATLVLVAVVTAFGSAVGVACGWYGGKLDTTLMRISDLFLAFPSLVFALAVAGVLGGGIQNAILALAFFAVRNSGHGRSAYYSIAACATASMFMVQVALNVFGSVDILPFTGVTFPFVSRGGTSVLACWMLLAFIKAGDTRKGASFVVRPPEAKTKKQRESAEEREETA